MGMQHSPRLSRSGFTLVELIITIAIIAGLVVIVFVAINPQKRLQDAQVAQEKNNAEQMTKALNLQIIDTFAVPNVSDPSITDICKAGENDPSCVNLDALVANGYIPSIPVTSAYKNDNVTKISGYQIERNGGYIAVCRRGECVGGAGGSSGGPGGGGSSSTSSPTPDLGSYNVVTPGNQTINEGTALVLTNIGQFADPTNNGPYTYTIDWGDGRPQDTGTATIDVVSGPTQGSFDGTHTYADNGQYTVTVMLTAANTIVAGSTFTVNVLNTAPTLTGMVNHILLTDAPLPVSFTGQFTDPGFNNPLNVGGEVQEIFTYSIDWGDGSPLQNGPPTITNQGSVGVPKQGSITGNHTYNTPGSYTITVVINDDDGGPDTETYNVNVTSVMGSNLNFPDGSYAGFPYQQVTDLTGSTPFTVAFWLKPGTSPNATILRYSQLIGAYGAFSIALLDGSRSIAVRTNWFGTVSSIGQATDVFPEGDTSFHHITITYDGAFSIPSNPISNVKLFVDGVQVAMPMGSMIGGTTGISALVFNDLSNGSLGNLDDVRIYNYDMSTTPANITLLSDTNAANNPSSGLLHYWNMNENTGTTVNDSIGSAHGSITNALWSNDAPF